MIAVAYLALGTRPIAAMLVNAAFGCAMALAVHRLVLPARRAAMASALVVSLHPALLPYTAAVMTEGVAASLVVIAVAFARRERLVALGLPASRSCRVVALGRRRRLVPRPQCARSSRRSCGISPRACIAGNDGAWCVLERAVLVTADRARRAALPWTVHNCVAMHAVRARQRQRGVEPRSSGAQTVQGRVARPWTFRRSAVRSGMRPRKTSASVTRRVAVIGHAPLALDGAGSPRSSPSPSTTPAPVRGTCTKPIRRGVRRSGEESTLGVVETLASAVVARSLRSRGSPSRMALGALHGSLLARFGRRPRRRSSFTARSPTSPSPRRSSSWGARWLARAPLLVPSDRDRHPRDRRHARRLLRRRAGRPRRRRRSSPPSPSRSVLVRVARGISCRRVGLRESVGRCDTLRGVDVAQAIAGLHAPNERWEDGRKVQTP